MPEFVARNIEMAGATHDLVTEQHDVDIESAAGKTWHVAAPTMAVLERVQPRVELRCRPLGIECNGQIEEGRPIEPDRLGAIGR